jgi:hypothetical protein
MLYYIIYRYGSICRHNDEYGYNDKYTGTSNGILAKRWLWLPDDGLCKPKHVAAAFYDFNCFNSLTI